MGLRSRLTPGNGCGASSSWSSSLDSSSSFSPCPSHAFLSKSTSNVLIFSSLSPPDFPRLHARETPNHRQPSHLVAQRHPAPTPPPARPLIRPPCVLRTDLILSYSAAFFSSISLAWAASLLSCAVGSWYWTSSRALRPASPLFCFSHEVEGVFLGGRVGRCLSALSRVEACLLESEEEGLVSEGVAGRG